jgi:hypothetical protein
VAETGHSLVLNAEVSQGRRIELARVAAQLEQDEMAQAAGISVRSYQRTVAGTRVAQHGELTIWAELTGQNLCLFESDSWDGAPILSHSRPPVKRPRKAA